MSRPIVRALAAVVAVTALACSDSLAPEDLAGTWEATSMTFTSVANPSVTDQVISGDYAFTLILASNGVATLTFTDGVDSETDTGTWSLSGDMLTLTIEGDPATGTVDLNGNTVTIALTTGVEYDFDDDGIDEAATLLLVATRQ